MASLAVQLRELRDRLTDRATLRSDRVKMLASDQSAALLRAVTSASLRIKPPVDDDPQSVARAARRLRSQGGIGRTIDIARARARDFLKSEMTAAAVSGYRQDQSQRKTMYDAATADFISVDTTEPDGVELAPIRAITINGRTAANWAEIDSTALWSSLLGAFSNRVASETGGWETGLRLLSKRIGTAFDSYATRAANLAFHFYLTGVLASGREVAAAFDTAAFEGDESM